MRRLAVVLLLFAGASFAAIPHVLSWQGLLTDSAGNVLEDGTYALTFSFFADAEASDSVWGETKELAVRGGMVYTMLGDRAPLDAELFAEPLWFAVAVDGQRVGPAVQFGAIGYAMRAAVADSSVRSGSTKGITVDDSGRVGIGTTEPKQQLHLIGAGPYSGDIRLEHPQSDTYWELNARNSGHLDISNEGSDSTVRIDSNGNVGIGTKQFRNRLEVKGGLLVGNEFCGDSLAPVGGIKTEGSIHSHGSITVEHDSIKMRIYDDVDTRGWVRLRADKGRGFSLSGANDYSLFAADTASKVSIGRYSLKSPYLFRSRFTVHTSPYTSKEGMIISDGAAHFHIQHKGDRQGDWYMLSSGKIGNIFIGREEAEKTCNVIIYDKAAVGKPTINNGVLDVGGDIYSSGMLVCSGTSCSSDSSLKTDIRPLNGALEKVMELNGVRFRWKKGVGSADDNIGFVAQKVEKIFPEFVHTRPDGQKSISYDKMTAVLVEAVKQQQSMIQDLRLEVGRLKQGKQ